MYTYPKWSPFIQKSCPGASSFWMLPLLLYSVSIAIISSHTASFAQSSFFLMRFVCLSFQISADHPPSRRRQTQPAAACTRAQTPLPSARGEQREAMKREAKEPRVTSLRR